MKTLLTISALLAIMICGCETDAELYNRVLQKKIEYDTANGGQVLLIHPDGYRRTLINLDNGKTIVFKSGKHDHNVYVVDTQKLKDIEQ